MDRRRVLATIGTATATSLAGCVGVGESLKIFQVPDTVQFVATNRLAADATISLHVIGLRGNAKTLAYTIVGVPSKSEEVEIARIDLSDYLTHPRLAVSVAVYSSLISEPYHSTDVKPACNPIFPIEIAEDEFSTVYHC